MKILIITQRYYPEKNIVKSFAEGLYKRGHNVTVLTAKPSFGLGYILPGYQNISYELAGGIKVHRVDVKPRRNSRISLMRNDRTFYRNSRKWVKRTKEQFDVVYTYAFSPATNLSAGNLYKKKHHVPHVVHLTEITPDYAIDKHYISKFNPLYFLLYLLSRKEYKKPDELLVSSPIYEDYLRNKLHLKKANITYVPTLPLIEEGIKDPYQYPKGFNILYHGDIDKAHILDILPEAMGKVSNHDVYFHLFGKGKLSKELLDTINEWRLGNRIILHGDKPLNDMHNFYENCDACYVSLSSKTYNGRAINDKHLFAMAYKKPIIAVAEGDSAEILKESGGGFLLNENVDDLVFAIGKASSTSKKELEKKGNSNYDYFLKHFDLNDIVGKIESILLKKSL